MTSSLEGIQNRKGVPVKSLENILSLSPILCITYFTYYI